MKFCLHRWIKDPPCDTDIKKIIFEEKDYKIPYSFGVDTDLFFLRKGMYYGDNNKTA